MGHRITTTENVDGTNFKLTLEKGDNGQYHEIDREPLTMGAVARMVRMPLRLVRWLFRLVWRMLSWPFRAVRECAGNGACWLERTWADTDPALDVVPAENDPRLPTDEQLKVAKLSDDAIARLRKNPKGFPHTLRRFGVFDFGRVRGRGLGRVVGTLRFILRS